MTTPSQTACETSKASPALTKQAKDYPTRFKGRVPWKVKVLMDVKSDLPVMAVKPGTKLNNGDIVECWVNSYGAVAGVCANGEKLGLKPDEYEVAAWHGGASNELLTVTIARCPRCGEPHKDTIFKQFSVPAGDDSYYTHWALCPDLGELILHHPEEE